MEINYQPIKLWMHPEEWEKLKGVKIKDPDGWRNARKSWDDFVTEEEFDKLLAGCTVEYERTETR